MSSYQKMIVLGNLARDPETRYSQAGDPICNFAVAVNRTWTAGNGEKKEEVTFFDCVAFGKVAELSEKYLKKGAPAFIEGRFKTDSWEDKQTGAKRSKLVLVVEQLRLLGGKDKAAAPNVKTEDTDDIPF